jgi:hypothetical protein
MIMKPLALAGFSFFVGSTALEANMFVKHSFSYLPTLRAILLRMASVEKFSVLFITFFKNEACIVLLRRSYDGPLANNCPKRLTLIAFHLLLKALTEQLAGQPPGGRVAS